MLSSCWCLFNTGLSVFWEKKTIRNGFLLKSAINFVVYSAFIPGTTLDAKVLLKHNSCF